MKSVQVVLAIVVAIGAGATGYFLLRSSDGSSAVPTPVVTQSLLPAPSPTPVERSPAKFKVGVQPTATIGYQKVFAESTDYYDFVRHAIDAARAGNPQAQFYISEALAYCQEGYDRYFHKPSPDLPIPSLEEQIGKYQGQLSHHVAMVRSVYIHCHELMENDVAQWGTREEWLAKATDSGLPAAQARAASLLLSAQVLQEPSPIKTQEEDPRILLRRALESKDATALMVSASFLRTLDELNNPQLNDARAQDERTENTLAWWLLACNRGYDCSENSPWFVEICASDRQCQSGTSPADYIHQTAESMHFADLDQRAEELSAKVDAKAWGDLGLGGG